MEMEMVPKSSIRRLAYSSLFFFLTLHKKYDLSYPKYVLAAPDPVRNKGKQSGGFFFLKRKFQ